MKTRTGGRAVDMSIGNGETDNSLNLTVLLQGSNYAQSNQVEESKTQYPFSKQVITMTPCHKVKR